MSDPSTLRHLGPRPHDPAPTDRSRPDLFRLARRDDADRLRRLLRADPGLAVADTLQGQLEELVATRHPDRTLPPDERRRLATALLGDRPAAEHGVWVHYPWSRRVVHLLDEPEFAELRTSRNRYKITAAEQATLGQLRVGVIGLSVGQSVAVTMAVERGFGEIRLADFDTLELSNLNRIRAGVHNLGLPKVVVAAREIAEIDPFLRVVCFPAGIDEANLDRFLLDGGKLDLLVEECDGIDVKVLARQRARELGIPVVMETSDRGMLDVERFDLEPRRPLFYGLAGDLDHRALAGLSAEEKIPHVLAITGIETLSPRMKASMVEVGQTIPTWPQLASAVALGGAVGADVCRRIALGQLRALGRFFVDLEELVGDPVPSTAPSFPEAASRAASGMTLTNEGVRGILARVDRKPVNGQMVPDRTCIGEMVEAATLAPSGGNSQPWLWVFNNDGLFLFHDEARSESFLDYGELSSFTALGAAAENLVLHAHSQGFDVDIRPLPLPDDPRLAAAFRFLRKHPAGRGESHSWDHLAAAIPLRHTNRRRGKPQPIDPAVLPCLRSAAESFPGARLHVLESESDLAQVAEILGAAERLRILHRESHRDLMDELRWSPEDAARTGDGIDLATLELSPMDLAGLRACRSWDVVDLVRQWGGGQSLARLTARAALASSAVALLTVPGDGPVGYLAGGRAMQRAWLAATQGGLAMQPISSLPYLFARLLRGGGVGMPTEQAADLTAVRASYLRLFPVDDGAAEILLFRLAVAGPPSARSLRRPVADVLRFH